MNHDKCSRCQKPARTLTQIDEPPGFELCERCLEGVWECENCGKRTLRQRTKDLIQVAALVETSGWCLACCLERIAECERCGERDKIGELVATESGLYCESCLAAPASLQSEHFPITRDNWQEIVIAAIDALPGNLGSLVGYERHSANRLDLIAAEDAPRFPHGVKVVPTFFMWWDSRREQLEEILGRRLLDMSQEVDEFEATRPMYDEPTIAIIDGAGSTPQLRFNPTRSSAHDLTFLVRTVMLYVLCQCGSYTPTNGDSGADESIQ